MTDEKPDTKATDETRKLLNEITPQRTRDQQASDAEAEKAAVQNADSTTEAAPKAPADGGTTTS